MLNITSYWENSEDSGVLGLMTCPHADITIYLPNHTSLVPPNLDITIGAWGLFDKQFGHTNYICCHQPLTACPVTALSWDRRRQRAVRPC